MVKKEEIKRLKKENRMLRKILKSLKKPLLKSRIKIDKLDK